MPGRSRFVLGSALALVVVLAGGAGAHPGHGGQHGSGEGHLPPRQDDVRLVGRAQVADRTAERVGIEDRIADVAAHGDHAYLAATFEPTCEAGGVHVVDIADPAAPAEVVDAFIPAKTGQFVGEGLQVIEYDNRHHRGPVLFHSNETCADPAEGEPLERSGGGVSLWDVTDPRDPSPLTQNAGDQTAEDGSPEPRAHDTHSVFAWSSATGDRVYAALTDNQELTDVDILDVTDPRNPVLVNDTLDLGAEPFQVGQEAPGDLEEVFSHDMSVKRIGRTDVMTLNYWDGGYVLLDVTDPAPGRVRLIDETDYAQLDEEQAQLGRATPPEGNAHQSEISPDNRFVIGTDEDFSRFDITARITSGPAAGTTFAATPARSTPMLTETVTITGPTTYLGPACDPATVPPGTGVAVVEGGICNFQAQLDAAAGAGYSSVVVVRGVGGNCDFTGGVPGASSDTVPMVGVGRTAGLQILGQAFDPAAVCTTGTAVEVGATGADVDIAGRFDGWGYVRLFDTNLKRTRAGIVADQVQVDTYAIPEAQDPAYAVGFGRLSVHEVAIDPDPGENLAYFSYYAGGFRVAEYGEDGLREVGAFIDEGGSDLWGVQVHEVAGEQYVLASDRDHGLYIFQYDPAADGPEHDPAG